jgi:hypothetical protein
VDPFALNVTVFIQAACRVGLPTSVDPAEYVVDRIVETVAGIQPPKANPDLTIVPTVGSVRVSPNLYVSLEMLPDGFPESAPFLL